MYGLSTVDARGRLAERVVVRSLGWGPGTRLDIRERGGVLIVRAEARGRYYGQ
ncbi:hypothetical protein FHX69_1536 [Prauserella muralis]|nr:hypothetical protein FHX69_1536 [Prauserella muralis]